MIPTFLIALALGIPVDDRSPGYSGGPLSVAACFPDDVFLGFGDGATASCGDEPYYEGYNSSGQFEMWSLDCDGIATACAWVSVVNGTDDPVFSGDVGAVNATLSGDLGAVGGTFSGDVGAVNGAFSGTGTATGGLIVDSDTNGL